MIAIKIHSNNKLDLVLIFSHPEDNPGLADGYLLEAGEQEK